MATNHHKPNPNRLTPDSLTPEFLEDFAQTQLLKAQNETRQIALQEKHLDSQAKLAEKSLILEHENLKSSHGEIRKTMLTVGGIVVFLILIILGFLGLMVYTNHQDFANNFLHGLSYVVVGILSFLAGKKNKQSNSESTSEHQDAQIIN